MIFPTSFLTKVIRGFAKFGYRYSLFRKKRALPLLDVLEQSNTLFAFYDFRVQPLTYDFMWFLIAADIERKRLKLKCVRFVIVKLTKNTSDVEGIEYNSLISPKRSDKRIESIFFSGIETLPSSSGYDFIEDPDELEKLFILQKYIFPKDYTPKYPERVELQNYIKNINEKNTTFLRAPFDAKRAVGSISKI